MFASFFRLWPIPNTICIPIDKKNTNFWNIINTVHLQVWLLDSNSQIYGLHQLYLQFFFFFGKTTAHVKVNLIYLCAITTFRKQSPAIFINPLKLKNERCPILISPFKCRLFFPKPSQIKIDSLYLVLTAIKSLLASAKEPS